MPRDWLTRKRPPISESDYAVEDRGYDTPCWIWAHHIRDNGYGGVSHKGKARRAHVVAYLEQVGPIPDGLELDHLCRVRSCVNPAHLEPVTRGENLRRSPLVGRTKMKAHCPQGHEFTPENTYLSKRNARHCRTCDRIRADEKRRREGRPQRGKGVRHQ